MPVLIFIINIYCKWFYYINSYLGKVNYEYWDGIQSMELHGSWSLGVAETLHENVEPKGAIDRERKRECVIVGER